ncbi:cation transporter [Fundidesulfovibrio butyratiphilus]
MKTIEVKGMSCNHCVQSVTKALSAVDGVTGVKVDLQGAKATFEEAKPVDEAALKKAIEDVGFEAGKVS